MSNDLVTVWDDLKDNMPESHAEAAEAMYDLGDKMADRIEALEAENARLREALKPFSEEAGWWLSKGYNASEPPVEGFDDYQGVMTCGDLFNARAALQGND